MCVSMTGMLFGALSACEDRARAAPPTIRLRRFTNKILYAGASRRNFCSIPDRRRRRGHGDPHHERGAFARRAAYADLCPMCSRDTLRNREPQPISLACARLVGPVKTLKDVR